MQHFAFLLDDLTSITAVAAELKLWPFAAAIPYMIVPILMLLRLRGSRTLDGEQTGPPPGAPLLSVIIPARNEARNIARCLSGALGATYRDIEVIVVNDHSDDDTGTIARDIAVRDRRVRVIEPPPLPNGWFGKQWACENGAMAASGSFLLFLDADTLPGPELFALAVNAMRERRLGFLSVVGRQEMKSFWERVVQPHIFALIALRFGGTGEVNASRRVEDKISNGQCIFMTRMAYERIGGHASVRAKPAEDLALAQQAFIEGIAPEMIIGMDHLATRMYRSLREIIDGWTKNIFTAAPDAMPGGTAGRILIPLLLVGVPVLVLAPPLVILAQFVLPVSINLIAWAMLGTGAMLVFWFLIYGALAGYTPLYAFTFPLGAGVVLYIVVRAIWRGRHVSWKGREYVT